MNKIMIRKQAFETSEIVNDLDLTFYDLNQSFPRFRLFDISIDPATVVDIDSYFMNPYLESNLFITILKILIHEFQMISFTCNNNSHTNNAKSSVGK